MASPESNSSEHQQSIEPLGDDARRVEQALRQFQPRPSKVDRERLMFLAGQASGANARERPKTWWLWPASTLAMSTVATCLAVALTVQLSRPPDEKLIVREVVVPVQVPQSNGLANEPLPTMSPRQFTSTPIALSLPAGSVLQLRNVALRFGVEALPTAGNSNPTTTMPSVPLNQWQQLRDAAADSESSL